MDKLRFLRNELISISFGAIVSVITNSIDVTKATFLSKPEFIVPFLIVYSIHNYRSSRERENTNSILSQIPEQNIVNNLYHYRNDYLDCVGREDEIDRLLEFVNKPEAFLWMGIVGESGIGKSKLVRCFSKKDVVAHWNIVWLHEADLNELIDNNAVNFSRDTLFIVDYAGQMASELGKYLFMISRRRNLSRKKIRVIVIERENVYRIGDTRGGMSSIRYPEWYLNIVSDNDERRRRIENCGFHFSDENLFLTLSPLNEEAYLSIIMMFGKCRNTNLSETECGKILAFCKEMIQNKAISKVLYVEIATDMWLAKKRKIKEFSEFDILDYAVDINLPINNTIRKRNVSLYANLKILLVIATVARGLDLNEMIPHSILEKIRKNIIDMPSEDRDMIISSLNHSKSLTYIDPIEPDLFGEYFVIKEMVYLHKSSPDIFDAIRLVMWQNTRTTANFLLQCIQDFASIPEFVNSFSTDEYSRFKPQRGSFESEKDYYQAIQVYVSMLTFFAYAELDCDKAYELIDYVKENSDWNNSQDIVRYMILLQSVYFNSGKTHDYVFTAVKEMYEDKKDNEAVVDGYLNILASQCGNKDLPFIVEAVEEIDRINSTKGGRYSTYLAEALVEWQFNSSGEGVDTATSRIKELYKDNPNDEMIKWRYSSALCNSISSCEFETAKKRYGALQELVLSVESSQDECRKSVLISYSYGIYSMCKKDELSDGVAYLKDVIEAMAAFEGFEDDFFFRTCAETLVEICGRINTPCKSECLKKLDGLFHDKEDIEYLYYYADALANSCKSALANDELNELAKLYSKYDDERIAKAYMQAMMNRHPHIAKKANKENYNKVKNIYLTCYEKDRLAGTYSAAVLLYANKMNRTQFQKALNELKKVYVDYPLNSEVVSNYATGLVTSITLEDTAEQALNYTKTIAQIRSNIEDEWVDYCYSLAELGMLIKGDGKYDKKALIEVRNVCQVHSNRKFTELYLQALLLSVRFSCDYESVFEEISHIYEGYKESSIITSCYLYVVINNNEGNDVEYYIQKYGTVYEQMIRDALIMDPLRYLIKHGGNVMVTMIKTNIIKVG